MRGLENFTVVLIQVEVFWIVTPCSVVVGYHWQHYTASQPRIPRLESLEIIK